MTRPEQGGPQARAARVETFRDAGAQARRAAELTARALSRGVAARGAASLAVSGGTTPARYFEELAGLDLPWGAIHLFFVDERCVSPDDARANFRLVRDHLLARAPLPGENVWPMPGDSPPAEGAARYEATLRRVFAERLGQPGPALPRLDCLHLGLGADGHTASLFPGRFDPDAQGRLVEAVFPDRADPPVPRLTLTLPVLCAAREAFFLVCGPDKAALARSVAEGKDATGLPAALVRPENPPTWLVFG